MGTSLCPQQWSTTAANNNTADTGLPTLSNSMTPTHDTYRGMMAALKRYILDVSGAPAAVGGTADAITITTNQVISTAHQAAGFSLRFKAGGTNTGATTVAVDGLSATAIERMDGTGLSAGDIVSGGIYDIAYNATNGGYTLMGSGIYQPLDADLTAIGALAKTDGNFIVGNGSTWVAKSGATVRTSLGLGTGDSPTFTGLTLTGAITLGTDLSVAQGGTGASSAADARTNLGLVIGTDVQAFDSDLATISGLSKTDGNVMFANGAAWTSTESQRRIDRYRCRAGERQWAGRW